MRRCWLKGAMGDAIHAVLCAAGYNLRFLLRVIRFFCAWVLLLQRGCSNLAQAGVLISRVL